MAPTILICDDEPTLRELMRVSLGDGYSFAEAADVAEAIELANAVHPDLGLLDVMMPGATGLSGLLSSSVVLPGSAEPASAIALLTMSGLSSSTRGHARWKGVSRATHWLGSVVDPRERSLRSSMNSSEPMYNAKWRVGRRSLA